MNTPEEIKKIARLRLREAKLLTENNLLDGAFYLTGYSVELMLKAKTCEHFGVPNLFDESGGDTKDQLQLWKIGEIRKAVKVHNLYQLLVFSGLKRKFDTDRASNKNLMKANSLLFGRWDENCRYLPEGTMTSKKDMAALVKALEENPNGIRTWIETN